MKNSVSILLIAGIILLVNLLSNQFFLRFDLTEDQQYTLSKATKDILKNLEEPVTVTAYFSEGLEPSIAKTKDDLRDMLTEYSTYSTGYVDYKFIDPTDDAIKQEAMQNGVAPVMINVREKDNFTQKQAFMGVTMQMGERQEVIPVVQPGLAMEYALSTNIKKLAIVDKPAIAFIQGHGEPGQQELAGAVQALSVLYNVETINLTNESSIADRFRAVAIIAPSDSISAADFSKLDDYLSRGGNIIVGCNAVVGDLQNSAGNPLTTGLETWLAEKSIQVERQFIIDNQCAPVTVQQQQGFFKVNTQVPFPFLPVVSNFADHPITKGLEQIVLPFASPVTFLGDSTKQFTPIVFSSEKSGTVNAPTFFDINNLPSTFPLSNLIIGGVVSGNLVGNTPSNLVVFGDGDFAVTGQQAGSQNDNVSLLVNSFDWLSDDTGLIDLRTKGVASRPIDQEFLGDEAEGRRNLIKYVNFGLPILLILIYGFYRFNQQRTLRLKRREESYA